MHIKTGQMETQPVIISATDTYAVSTVTLPVVLGRPDYVHR